MSLYLISPELSLVGLAVLVIFLDLVVKKKGVLPAVAVIGLVVPAVFTALLWGRQETSFAGMLAVDSFSLFFKFLFLGVTALVILASWDYRGRFPRLQGEFYALVLFSAAGMMLMAAARELISVYIALELTGISLYALVAFLRDQRSTEAGLKYLLLGAFSSAVLLYGMALVYGLTGTTHLDVIGDRVQAIAATGLRENSALLLGVVLIVAGFGFKIASVPFQMWVPDVYEGAPTPITAYLSVASKAAGFAVILRVFQTAFAAPEALALDWGRLFAVLAAISMTLGNVIALVQTDIKRLMGYSSIAQAGYLMVGLAAVSALGRSGVVFFLAGYALTNLAAFIAIIAISNKTRSYAIQDYSGMAKRAPLVAALLAFALISLTGIPPTAGFVGKVYIFNAAMQQDLAWLVIIAVLNAAVSAYYYLRIVKLMYVGAPLSEEKVPSSGPVRLALGISSLGVLVVGILPGPLIEVVEKAVAGFLP